MFVLKRMKKKKGEKKGLKNFMKQITNRSRMGKTEILVQEIKKPKKLQTIVSFFCSIILIILIILAIIL